MTSHFTFQPQSIMITAVGPEALAHPAHVLDVAVVLVAEARVAALAEAHLDAVHPRRDPLLGLLDHRADVLVVGVARGDRRQLLVDGAAEQVEHAGVPSSLPLMSQSAMSMAATA